MLTISDLDCRLGGRSLFERANLQLPARARIGLVGRNGAGKSTLLRLIMGLLESDGGMIERPRGSRIALVAQEAPAGAASARDHVLAADSERAALLTEQSEAQGLRAAMIAARLDEINAAAQPARAARILAGLGLDADMQALALDSLSGGWRMRVALAAALFAEPDLLLLDEPTNHLDLEAALWLEQFLRRYPRTLIMVSHDRLFLNAVADGIVAIEERALVFYPGDYDRFVRVRAERAAARVASAAKLEAQRAKMAAFVARFRANASKARQAQSRLKALAKLDSISLPPDEEAVALRFPEPGKLAPPLIRCEDVALGYGGAPVLSGVRFRLDPDDRIALLGANGNGKSTLARFLASLLAPLSGDIHKADRLRAGYFAQHQLESLDLMASAFTHLARLLPALRPAQIRARLGTFGFAQDKADVPVGALSGGEKARLNLALISYRAPNLLILDEPTNHLDIETREALIEALNGFDGAVVLISHDAHLIELVADRLWLVADGMVKPFAGDLADYRARIFSRLDGPRTAARPEPAAAGNRKTARRGAAALRARRQPLKQALTASEARLAALLEERRALERKLADPALYNDTGAKEALAEAARRRGALEQAIAAAEAIWLEAASALEAAEAAGA
jgi:ATP-binding cassette subfamily F protein 3